MHKTLTAFAFLLIPLPAAAEAPRVAADVPAVHSLVARVMQGVGDPALILPPGASPHDHAMRPSEAAAVEQADLLFWVGPEFTPWLSKAIATLAPDVRSVPLLEAEVTRRLPPRWVSEEAEEEAHEEEGHAEEGHGHEGEVDTHAWLDPENAALWLEEIARHLSQADPDNAQTYAANAAAGAEELAALTAELQAALAPVRGVTLVLYHDATQYFEARFGLQALGAMTLNEGPPRPRHLDELRAQAAGEDAVCVVLESPADPGLARAVAPEAPVVIMDTEGAALPIGPGYYPSLLRQLAEALAGCAD